MLTYVSSGILSDLLIKFHWILIKFGSTRIYWWGSMQMWMEKSMDTQCLCKLIWTIDNLRMRHCSLWISPPFLKIVNCVFVSVWTQILICILQRRVVFGRIYRDLCRQQVEASPFPVSCSQTQTHRSSSLLKVFDHCNAIQSVQKKKDFFMNF